MSLILGTAAVFCFCLFLFLSPVFASRGCLPGVGLVAQVMAFGITMLLKHSHHPLSTKMTKQTQNTRRRKKYFEEKKTFKKSCKMYFQSALFLDQVSENPLTLGPQFKTLPRYLMEPKMGNKELKPDS